VKYAVIGTTLGFQSSGSLFNIDQVAKRNEALLNAVFQRLAEFSTNWLTDRKKIPANAGAAHLYPQEITRALLPRPSARPSPAMIATSQVLRASTRSLGTVVEIRIRGNGTGIPPEVKEKMFLPFFTTKPTGEGTGLGLSMTHDIVKLHGGGSRSRPSLGRLPSSSLRCRAATGLRVSESPNDSYWHETDQACRSDDVRCQGAITDVTLAETCIGSSAT
jgi:hypothetical protein